MKTKLTVAEKQGILLGNLLENSFKHPSGYAVFGVEAAVVKPLIEKGWIHADTYKHVKGASLTAIGKEMLMAKMQEQL